MWRFTLVKSFMGHEAGTLVEANQMSVIKRLEGDDKNPPVGEKYLGSLKGILLKESKIKPKTKTKPEVKKEEIPESVAKKTSKPAVKKSDPKKVALTSRAKNKK